MKPLDRDENGWRVWGIPIGVDWWRAQDQGYTEALAKPIYVPDLEGPTAFAGMVAACVEQILEWQRGGVEIVGRKWVDVGGGNGHYSIALKILGASEASLMDVEPPSVWASPVLAAAGVDVILADGRTTGVPTADSACLLYNPGVGIIDVLEQNPSLTQVVWDDDLPPRWLREIGWSETLICQRESYFLLGEGGALPNQSGSVLIPESFYYIQGGVIQLPLPDDSFDEEFQLEWDEEQTSDDPPPTGTESIPSFTDDDIPF